MKQGMDRRLVLLLPLLGIMGLLALTHSSKDVPANDTVLTAAASADQDLLEATDQPDLDSALEHYQTARDYWDQGRIDEAYAESDQAFLMLSQVTGALTDEQERTRDDLRLMLSRLVVTMSAAQAGPIRGNSEIPLELNDYVKFELARFQTVERRYFVESFQRAGAYMPFIKTKLREAHMPEELAWLPLIESGFKLRALSPAAALGLWQFIPATGFRYGLKRDAWVDERMEPEKATEAAVAYLRQLHSLFGDWNTALAAYNCGEGAVGRALRRQSVEYLDSFWDLYPRLPRETARYVPRFIATLHIIKDPARFGFVEDLAKPVAPVRQYETVEVSRSLKLHQIAAALQIDADQLRTLNPHLKRDATPPRTSQLLVPVGQASVLMARLETMSEPAEPQVMLASAEVDEDAAPAARSGAKRYKVRKGDFPGKIAKKHGVSVESLLRANRMSKRARLSIGQVLSIPRSG